MDVSDVKRLKALEVENSRHKKLLAEAAPYNAIVKEINATKWYARSLAAESSIAA